MAVRRYQLFLAHALAEQRLADGRFVAVSLKFEDAETWNELDLRLDQAITEIATLPEAQ